MMIFQNRVMIALGAALIVCAGAQRAVAAPPDTAHYSFTCTYIPNGGEPQTGPVTPPLFTVEVTSFSFQSPAPIGATSSGAGAGKVTFSPFTVTLPAAQFTTTIYSALTANPLSSCSLTPSNESQPGWAFALVSLTGVAFTEGQNTGWGSRDDHNGVNGTVQLNFLFGALQLQTAGTNGGI